MFVVESYAVAVFMCFITMLCCKRMAVSTVLLGLFYRSGHTLSDTCIYYGKHRFIGKKFF